MNALLSIALLILLSLVKYSVNIMAVSECEDSASNSRTLTFSVNRKMNESDGIWLTTFSASKVDTEQSEVSLEGTHKHADCQGRHVINIEVIVKEVFQNQAAKSPDVKNSPLLFHPRHGSNVAIINNGRSVQKIDKGVPENSVAFTNRPLKAMEMFEVRLDKRGGAAPHCLGIGVMSSSPDDVEMVTSMHRLRSNSTWMYHNNGIYGNSENLVKNYGQDINKLQARDRVGVMQTENGTIHFFVNGEDQGPAVSNTPQPIYGVFELWHDALKGTIVY